MREEVESREELERSGNPAGSAARKRAEQELETERIQVLSIFDSIDEAIYVADPHSYEILFVNQALKNALGKDPTGGLCYVEFQGLEQPCELCTNPVLLASPGKTYHWEYHNPRLEHDYLIVDRLIRWSDGRDARFELALDITERKSMETKLKESEEYFRALIDNNLDIITVIDASGNILYINQAIRDILGHEPEGLIGKNGYKVFHPEDVPKAMETVSRASLDPGYSPKVVVRSRHKDGSYRYFEGIGKNYLDNPAVRGIVVSFRDITERKQAEDGLVESEEMHRALVAASPDAVTMSDLDGRIIYASPMSLKLYGCESEEELLGKSAFELIIPEERAKAIANLEVTLRDGSVRNLECTFLRRDGTTYIGELNAAIIRDAAGEPYRLVAFTRDISERKRMEKELRDRNEELEAFAHTISHDLLTPVAIVEGYAKAALEADAEGREEAERECLEAIARGARRMNDLIASLLQYAQAGHVDFDSFSVDPEEVLMEVLTDLEERIREKKARVELEADLPPVEVDPAKLRQAFNNLIANALKHMGDNPEPRVGVSASVQGGTATFCVRDNGMGIPSELHGKIFEPFRHFSLAGAQGLGIGLSTVKRAVTAWGGKVWVESQPGEGAAFFFTAPLAS